MLRRALIAEAHRNAALAVSINRHNQESGEWLPAGKLPFGLPNGCSAGNIAEGSACANVQLKVRK